MDELTPLEKALGAHLRARPAALTGDCPPPSGILAALDRKRLPASMRRHVASCPGCLPLYLELASLPAPAPAAPTRRPVTLCILETVRAGVSTLRAVLEPPALPSLPALADLWRAHLEPVPGALLRGSEAREEGGARSSFGPVALGQVLVAGEVARRPEGFSLLLLALEAGQPGSPCGGLRISIGRGRSRVDEVTTSPTGIGFLAGLSAGRYRLVLPGGEAMELVLPGRRGAERRPRS